MDYKKIWHIMLITDIGKRVGYAAIHNLISIDILLDEFNENNFENLG